MSASQTEIRRFNNINEQKMGLENKDNEIEDLKPLSPVINLHDKFRDVLNESPLHLSDSEAEDDPPALPDSMLPMETEEIDCKTETVDQEIDSDKSILNESKIDESVIEINVDNNLNKINEIQDESNNTMKDSSQNDDLSEDICTVSTLIVNSETNNLTNEEITVKEELFKNNFENLICEKSETEIDETNVLQNGKEHESEDKMIIVENEKSLEDAHKSEDSNERTTSPLQIVDLDITINISDSDLSKTFDDTKIPDASIEEIQDQNVKPIIKNQITNDLSDMDKKPSVDSIMENDIILLNSQAAAQKDKIDEKQRHQNVQTGTDDSNDAENTLYLSKKDTNSDIEDKSQDSNSSSRQSKRNGSSNIEELDGSLTKKIKLDEPINLVDEEDMVIETISDENNKIDKINQTQNRIQRVVKTYNKMQDALIGMTRSDVEWFVAGKIVDALDAGSELAQARSLIEALQRRVEKLESQLSVVTKHVCDLNFLHNKCMSSINMGKTRSGQILAHPHYVTRSVGLQVCITGSSIVNWNNRNSKKITDSTSGDSQQQQRNANTSAKQKEKQDNSLLNNSNSSGPTADPPPMPVKLIRNLNVVPQAASNTGNNVTIVDLTEEEEEQEINATKNKNVSKSVTTTSVNGNPPIQRSNSNTNIVGNNAGTFITTKRLPPLPSSQYSSPLITQQQRRLLRPSRPIVTINQVVQGIVISWTMPDETAEHAKIVSYQIYAYQEGDTSSSNSVSALNSGVLSSDLWRKVGDVKAMALPMACTLTQFTLGNRYHFAVRAVDAQSRVGHFSVPKTIQLNENVK